jgi:hypothetical protein
VKTFLIAAVCAALWATAAEASGFTVYGQGALSCGQWLSDRQDPYLKPGANQWLLGFISAAGDYSGEPLAKTDADGLTAWVDRYCQAHPLDDAITAAERLAEALAKRKRTAQYVPFPAPPVPQPITPMPPLPPPPAPGTPGGIYMPPRAA